MVAISGHFGGRLEIRRHSQRNGRGFGLRTSPRHTVNVLRFLVQIQYIVLHLAGNL